ncbi:MAG TPA: hypothetical protein VIS72_12530 [Anaerolineales bacterium]
MEIEEILASEVLVIKKLEQNAFGIFRLVTESYGFEQSNFGKVLLEIRVKIKNLTRT